MGRNAREVMGLCHYIFRKRFELSCFVCIGILPVGFQITSKLWSLWSPHFGRVESIKKINEGEISSISKMLFCSIEIACKNIF